MSEEEAIFFWSECSEESGVMEGWSDGLAVNRYALQILLRSTQIWSDLLGSGQTDNFFRANWGEWERTGARNSGLVDLWIDGF